MATGSFQFFLSKMEFSVLLLRPVGYGALLSLRCIGNRLRKGAVDVEHETLFPFTVETRFKRCAVELVAVNLNEF